MSLGLEVSVSISIEWFGKVLSVAFNLFFPARPLFIQTEQGLSIPFLFAALKTALK